MKEDEKVVRKNQNKKLNEKDKNKMKGFSAKPELIFFIIVLIVIILLLFGSGLLQGLFK